MKAICTFEFRISKRAYQRKNCHAHECTRKGPYYVILTGNGFYVLSAYCLKHAKSFANMNSGMYVTREGLKITDA